MNDNPNQPRKYDAVLGGVSPAPLQGAILGGMQGVKHRLNSPIIEARIAALNEALNYGEEGLNLIIAALDNNFRKVRYVAAQLLQQRKNEQAKLALQNYKFWSGFERYNRLQPKFITTFANRKIIEFDSKAGITDIVATAYALRVNYKCNKYKLEHNMEIVDKLQILLKDPLANQVEALVFGFWNTKKYYNSSRHVVDALIDVHEQLPNLNALFIGDIEDCQCMISSITQSNLSLIFVAYPELEVMKIRGDRFYHLEEGLSFDRLRHDKLKALIIESGGLRREVINQICRLELPALEYLELWTGRDDYGGTSSIEDVMPIISGQQFPKLKYLGLRNSQYSDDIAFAIVQSPLIEQLIELDFSMGTLGDEGAEALLNCPAVNQLDTLNVDDNCLSRPMVARLKQLDIEVIASHQKSSHNYRYCSVAE